MIFNVFTKNQNLCERLCFLILQLEVLEILVQNGADLNARTKHDETPAGIAYFSLSCSFPVLFYFYIISKLVIV